MNSSRGITGTGIKIIAIIIMLLDHIGAGILKFTVDFSGVNPLSMSSVFGSGRIGVIVYFLLRKVGRLAFPLFIFFLIEGFIHTRSRLRYLFRLLLFTIISEIPFDLAFYHELIHPQYQNVFFTLTIGFLGIWGIEAVLKALLREQDYTAYGPAISVRLIAAVTVSVIIMLVSMMAAFLLNTDYGEEGVMTIIIMYIVRRFGNRGRATFAFELFVGAAILTWFNFGEVTAFLDIILINMYNEKRGAGMKYLFYLFYPVHLLILYGVCIWL